MTAKVHIVVQDGELSKGAIEALCGKTVVHPQVVFMWDDLAMNAPLPDLELRGVCRNCCATYAIWPDGTVYGIRERQDGQSEQDNRRGVG